MPSGRGSPSSTSADSRALQVAAILGVRAEPWLLAAVAGEDILGIDDCLRIGLLTKADGIAFAHELTRMVVLEDLPVIHGIALHRRALAALEQAGVGDPARLAYHAEGAAERDAVLRHAAAAGHRAFASGSHREAIAQFERALRFADGIAPDARAALLEPLSQALSLNINNPEAYQAAAEAAALRRKAGDDLATAAGLPFLAEVAWRADHGPEAWSAAREAIALAEPMGDGRELAMAYAALGRLEMLNGQNREGRATSERALEIARRIEDAEVTAVALATIGSIELDQGDERGWADLGESARICRELHLPHLVDRALWSLGHAAFVWRRYELAREYRQQLKEYFQGLWGSEIDLYGIDSPMAEIEFVLGDWDAAVARGHAALDGPEEALGGTDHGADGAGPDRLPTGRARLAGAPRRAAELRRGPRIGGSAGRAGALGGRSGGGMDIGRSGAHRAQAPCRLRRRLSRGESRGDRRARDVAVARRCAFRAR